MSDVANTTLSSDCPKAGGGSAITYWLAGIAVSLATFMEVLDTSVANVALGHIAGNLSASSDEATWVLTSYLVANAIILPMSGWFSALLGRKRFYMICVVLFTLTSFLCGTSTSLGMLIFFRILQGLSGGGLAPLSQAIIADAFPVEKRGVGMALFGITVVAAPVIGPSLGGWITDSYSWHWIFLINVPVGILAVVANSFLLKDPPHLVRIKRGNGFRINYAGIVFLAIGLGALQIMLDKGQREDWFESGYIVTLTVIAAVFLAVSVIWELYHQSPVADYRLLKDRNFSLATLVFFMFGFLMYATTTLLPQFLQTLMGYSATLSGLMLSPGGLASMLVFPIVAMLSTRVDSRWLIVGGLCIGATGVFLMSSFSLAMGFSTGMWAYVVMMSGIGLIFVPISTLAFHYIPKEKYDSASGLFNLSRNIGGSVGISLAMTWVARGSQFHQHRLIDHITPFNPLSNMALKGSEGLLARFSPDQAARSAMSKSFVYGEIQRQAATMSFLDAFWIFAVLFLLTTGIVFFMKKVKPAKGPISIGH